MMVVDDKKKGQDLGQGCPLQLGGEGEGKEGKKNGNACRERVSLRMETEYIRMCVCLLILFQRYVSFGTQRKPDPSFWMKPFSKWIVRAAISTLFPIYDFTQRIINEAKKKKKIKDEQRGF